MSLRKAVNAKCRQCTYDPKDVGTYLQQIACCIDTSCPLHSVRPVTTVRITQQLLDAYRLDPSQLDERARRLLVQTNTSSEYVQNGVFLEGQVDPVGQPSEAGVRPTDPQISPLLSTDEGKQHTGGLA